MTIVDGSATPAEYVARGTDIAWRETADEIVILDLHDSIYFGLNPSGAILWKQLVLGATPSDLIDLLTAYGAAPESASQEVDDFLNALESHGLIRRC